MDEAALAAQVRLYRPAVLAGASQSGARQFCAIRSCLSTAAKHGLSLSGALVMLTEGHPWMPATARWSAITAAGPAHMPVR